MRLLELIVPLIAAAGWLWWLRRTDRFEREPWGLVLRTAGLGAVAGLVGLIGTNPSTASSTAVLRASGTG